MTVRGGRRGILNVPARAEKKKMQFGFFTFFFILNIHTLVLFRSALSSVISSSFSRSCSRDWASSLVSEASSYDVNPKEI